MTIGVLIYFLFGYALSRGDDWGSFIGTTKFGLFGVTGHELIVFVFQFSFAITTSAIVSGVLSERGDFSAFMWYNNILTGVVHPVAAHWVWSEEGWLNKMGMIDVAGSSVVHVCGGIAALVGTIMTGPRAGRFVDDVRTKGIRVAQLPHHSIPFFTLGGLILMSGFIAFNAGSNGRVTSCLDVDSSTGTTSHAILHTGRVMKLAVSTVLAGTSGGLAAFLSNLRAASTGKWSLVRGVLGSIAGMVAICGGAGRVSLGSTVLIGACGGLACNLTSWIMLHAVHEDDPVDSVAIHFGGGLVGTLLVGLLEEREGLLANGQWNLMWKQLYGLSAISAWSVGSMLIVFLILKMSGGLRVSLEEEADGLDKWSHEGFAYSFSATHHHQQQQQQSYSLQHQQLSHRGIATNSSPLVQVAPQDCLHLRNNIPQSAPSKDDGTAVTSQDLNLLNGTNQSCKIDLSGPVIHNYEIDDMNSSSDLIKTGQDLRRRGV